MLPSAFVAVSLTDHVPVVNDSVGFCEVAPLEKFDHPEPLFFSHNHDVGVLVLESVNTTESGVVPNVGVPEKLATGGFTAV